MDAEPDIATVAAALANRARIAMLTAMLDGRPHPAGDLAREAGVALSTATTHLAELVAVGLIVGSRDGRQRRFRIRGPRVADALEALGALAPHGQVRSAKRPEAALLQAGRTCFDHLAGRLGIAITDALLAAGAIQEDDGGFSLSDVGRTQFERMGVDVRGARRRRRAFTVACLDWTEHRHHLGGALGAALGELLMTRGYVRRIGSDRAVELTPMGARWLARVLGSAWVGVANDGSAAATTR
jgi:DNA-binding transcriptional ArsR family regulator